MTGDLTAELRDIVRTYVDEFAAALVIDKAKLPQTHRGLLDAVTVQARTIKAISDSVYCLPEFDAAGALEDRVSQLVGAYSKLDKAVGSLERENADLHKQQVASAAIFGDVVQVRDAAIRERSDAHNKLTGLGVKASTIIGRSPVATTPFEAITAALNELSDWRTGRRRRLPTAPVANADLAQENAMLRVALRDAQAKNAKLERKLQK